MLSTRLWMGTVLIAAGLGILVGDQFFAPYYPGLLLLTMVLGIVACRELLWLVRQDHFISAVLCHAGVLLVLAANWLAHVVKYGDPWHWVFGVFIGYFFALFLAEMAIFRRPSGAMVRIALSLWIVAYLAILSSFLIQLRWFGDLTNSAWFINEGTTALVMTIFVPKCCDMGAFFSGKLLGRTRVAPKLSPGKTWEGAIGGLLVAVLVTIAIDRLGPFPMLGKNIAAEIGFGVTVGGAGILGDLGESLIKREYQQKDASKVVPGFGGVLDVVDAVLFAGPVAFVWFVFIGPLLNGA